MPRRAPFSSVWSRGTPWGQGVDLGRDVEQHPVHPDARRCLGVVHDQCEGAGRPWNLRPGQRRAEILAIPDVVRGIHCPSRNAGHSSRIGRPQSIRPGGGWTPAVASRASSVSRAASSAFSLTGARGSPVRARRQGRPASAAVREDHPRHRPRDAQGSRPWLARDKKRGLRP